MWSALLGALALGGCASQSVSREDVEGMRSEIKTLHDQQVAQQKEIARLRAEMREQRQAPSPTAPPETAQKASGAVPVATSTHYAMPDNLKVVVLTPPPVEFSDDSTPQAPPPPRHHAPLPPAGPLPTATPLKEPVLADINPQPVPDSAILDVQYKVALSAPNAVDQLEAFAKAHPEHPSADNALFEAGLRAERAGDPDRAAHDFEKAVIEHPAGDTVADSLLHLAACDLTLHRTSAARHALEQLSTQFAGSAQADAARSRLADLP